MMDPFYQSIQEFIFLENEPAKAALIFLPGGPATEPVHRAAGLWREGYAPLIAVSGSCSILTGHPASKEGEAAGFATECDYFADLLIRDGVDPEAIIREEEAQYTYQNAVFTRRLLEKKGLVPETALLCCQAYHARRAFLYYQEQFPDTRILVCPSVTQGVSRDNWFKTPKGIDMVLGEVERCGAQFHEIMRGHMTDC